MPGAGPGEATVALLRAAVSDADTVNRFRSKVRRLDGSGCEWWTRAVSGRGHGRFWLGRVDGRDVAVIAHRFAWALEFGVDELLRVPVLGHRCDNPLCQRIDDGHVRRSSHTENRREWAARRHTIGSPLRDSRGARGRVGAVRQALRAGADGPMVSAVAVAGLLNDLAQLPLWLEASGPAAAAVLVLAGGRIGGPGGGYDRAAGQLGAADAVARGKWTGSGCCVSVGRGWLGGGAGGAA